MLGRRLVRPERHDRCPSPHAIGHHCVGGPNEQQPEHRWYIWQDKGKGIHARVKDGGAQNISSGTVVDPGHDDGDRNQKDHTDLKVVDQVVAPSTRKIEGGMTQSPRKPYLCCKLRSKYPRQPGSSKEPVKNKLRRDRSAP